MSHLVRETEMQNNTPILQPKSNKHPNNMDKGFMKEPERVVDQPLSVIILHEALISDY